MTLQAKPAENTRCVISARMRSSPSFVSAFRSGLSGSSFASAFGPPLRFSALARMVLKEIIVPDLLQRRQQSGHQPAAFGKAFDDDVLVERVGIRAAHAEAV